MGFMDRIVVSCLFSPLVNRLGVSSRKIFDFWLFVTCYGSIGGHKSTKSLSGKGFN
ncbi:hypothetical protein C789_3981 [Microcystis aeruginosa FACHB-905 = DIANCHI905]|nr:hypothetical protein C789_3981 [Microcystis aeruginosa FACHB-905 = DIANCHI905]